MAIYADSSVLVAASHRAHPDHPRVLNWLQHAVVRTDVVTSAHALAEVFGTLTRRDRRGMFRLAPRDAERIVTRLRRRLKVAALSVKDYREAITMAVDRSLTGPVFYDMLHAQAARKAGAQRIATLNTADFRRIWTPSQIIEP